MSSLKPIGTRLLVKVKEADSVSPGGIIIPDIGKDKPLQGEVVEVGAGVKELQIGHQVFFGKYAGTDVAVGSTPHIIIKEEEVLAYFEKAES